MNYFNYFTEIEDAFVRRRGKHLLISPTDWALIESWKQSEIPLHIVLRGIERAFDSWEAKPRKRKVKSLLYCQEEVEAQYAEWLESRVGTGDEENETEVEEESAFSRAGVLEHLERSITKLSAAAAKRKIAGEDDLAEAMQRGISLLEDLERDSAAAPRVESRKLEDSLTGIERMLNEAMRQAAAGPNLDSLQKEVAQQLRPYRSQIEDQVYQQMVENLLLKRLREQFGVPRLSLFYL